MNIRLRTQSIINLVGFIAFVLFSFALSIGLLVLTSIVICQFFGIDIVWAIPLGFVIILLLSIAQALTVKDSALRARLPKSLQRIRPEYIKDVLIVVFGTAVGPIIVYAFTKSTTIALIVGAISFLYFYYIQSAIRWSRTGFKLIPKWHYEQQKIAEHLINRLRSGDKNYDRTYCFFVRPFELIPYEYNLYRDEYVHLEEQIADMIRLVCPVIALGRKLPIGPGYISSDNWQNDVSLLMKHAAVILVLPDETPGMVYEIDHIIQNSYLPKTFFVGPPTAQNTEHWKKQWKVINVQLESAGFHVPAYRDTGLVFLYLQERSNPIVKDLSGDLRNIDYMREFISERVNPNYSMT